MANTNDFDVKFRDPSDTLKGGYDVHVYFELNQRLLAISIYENFLSYLKIHGVTPTFSYVYDSPPDFEGGPHRGPMWVVQLMGINPARDIIQEGGNAKAIQQLGFAVAWLMLNRHGLKVLLHSNVAMPFGQVELEKIDHTEHALWMGATDPIPDVLNLEFFDQLLTKEAKDAQAEAIQRLERLTATSNTV